MSAVTPETFADVAEAVGLYRRGEPQDIWGPNAVDYNADGYTDFLFTNHFRRSSIAYPTLLKLHKQRSDGSFVDVAASSGINLWEDKHGAAWGDCDNDRRLELYISIGANRGTLHKPKKLYLRQSGDTFKDIAAAAGVTNDTVAFASARQAYWVDYDNDGDLDLHTTNSRNSTSDPVPDILWRNDGPCTYTSMLNKAGALSTDSSYHQFGASWADYDNDGDMDVLMSLGTSAELFRNNNGTFENVTGAVGITTNTRFMGIAWGDYDNDGDLDLLLTRSYSVNRTPITPNNALYRNMLKESGTARFTDVAQAANLIGNLNSQDAVWADYDNDGDLDLFVVNAGNVNVGNQRDFLFENLGNRRFQEVGQAKGASGPVGPMSTAGLGGAVAASDYNRDGYVDFVVTNGGVEEYSAYGPQVLLQNGGGYGNRWLKIKLVGRRYLDRARGSNSLGIGARVEVVTTDGLRQTREMNGGLHRNAQDDLLLHFGLGKRVISEIIVTWPNSPQQRVTGVTSNQVLTITEP